MFSTVTLSHFARLEILMEFLVNAVELIAIAG